MCSHRVCRCHQIVGDQSICSRAGLLYRGTRHRLEEWANLMKINKDKCKVLHLGRTPFRLGIDWLESSSGEKDIGPSVDRELSVSQ